METQGNTLHLEYYRSAIGRSWRQKRVVRGLGFTKLRQVVVRPDTPGIRGMVAKVPHLVRVLAEPEARRRETRSGGGFTL